MTTLMADRALCLALAAAGACVHDGRGAVDRARHRRQRGDLHARRSGAAAAPAGEGSGAPGDAERAAADEHYGSNYGANMLSYPMYEDFRDHNEVFDGMFCRYAFPVQIGGVSGASCSRAAGTERATGEMVSGTYFPVLGVRPALGRLFGTGRRSRARRGAVRRAEPRLLDQPLQPRSEHPGQGADRRRSTADHHRRRRGRLLRRGCRRALSRCSSRS